MSALTTPRPVSSPSSAIADAAQQPDRVIVVAHDVPLVDVSWTAQLALPDAK